MYKDSKVYTLNELPCLYTLTSRPSMPAFLKSVHEYAKCNKPQRETRVVVSYIAVYELANRGARSKELPYPASPARQLETSTSQ